MTQDAVVVAAVVEVPPPPRNQQIICAAGLIAGVVASYALLAVTPELLAHHVLILEAATGGIASIVTGGALASVGRDPLFLVVLAPMSSVLLYDVFYWWAGRLWGPVVIGRFVAQTPRWARWTARAEDLVRRRGIWALIASYLLPIPTVLVQVFCGVSGMPLWLYLIGDAIGLLLWIGLLVGVGWAIGTPAIHVVKAINHYSLWITVAIVVLIVASAVLKQSRAGGTTR
jgi:membrane-associated protein